MAYPKSINLPGMLFNIYSHQYHHNKNLQKRSFHPSSKNQGERDIDLFTQKERRPNTLRDRSHGMDEGKTLKEREGERKEKTGSAGPGRFRAGQKAHDGGLGDGVAEASRALSARMILVVKLKTSDSLNISERARWVACLLGRTRGHGREDIT